MIRVHRSCSIRTLSTALWIAFLFFAAIAPRFADAQEFGQFGNFGADLNSQPLELSAKFQVQEGAQTGRLSVTARLTDNWYIYSVTQPDGGPLRTKISIEDKSFELTGDFQPDKPAKVVKLDVFPGVPIEEHFDEVTWSAPIRWKDPVQFNEQSTISVKLQGQRCQVDGPCVPIRETISARFAGTIAAEAKGETEFRDPKSHVTWTASLSSGRIVSGETIYLTIMGTPDENYHLYPVDPIGDETSFRTLIVLSGDRALQFDKPTPKVEAVEKLLIPGEPKIRIHEGVAQWTIPVKLVGSPNAKSISIEGFVGYQACDDKSCDQPLGIKFKGQVAVAGDGSSNPVPLGIVPIKFKEVAAHPNRLTWFATQAVAPENSSQDATSRTEETEKKTAVVAQPLSAGTILTYIGMALLGGLILNFMPCVLPVIGLKLMGFVHKGSQDTTRDEKLDLWFIFGIMTVIWTLAGASIVANEVFNRTFSWGEQFTFTEFKVTLSLIVFALALSFLGVWELPIPGFAMSQKSGELMEQEGATGAFFKGVFTTVLATPCSGPFLGSVFTACLGQPSWVTFLLFTALGVGLASPYIVIAINPRLLWWLPKPGPWMNTLKELMAFPLLFTVVYLVFGINADYRIATLTALMVVWFACWWIGKVPGYASVPKRLGVWTASLVLVGVSTYTAFSMMGPIDKHLPWEPYTEARLKQLRSEGKTVMLDFTANWCATCQYNTGFVIHTAGVAEVVKRNHVIPLLADWTDMNDDIRAKLDELQSNSIPLLVVYPPDPNAAPIILRDVLTQSQLVGALEQAGPSRSANSKLTSTSPSEASAVQSN